MIRFENECVGCPPHMGCMGSACPYSHVPYLTCDKCEDEVEELYDTNEGQLCEECVRKMYDDLEVEEFRIIDVDNATDFVRCEDE